MNLVRVLLLVPIAYAEAFTVFPFVEPAMVPTSWFDVLIMVALLGPAYAYMLLAMWWCLSWDADRRFWGLSQRAWLPLIVLAYCLGGASVIFMAMV